MVSIGKPTQNAIRHLKVFVASPGDVADERSRVAKAAAELNATFERTLGVHLDCIRWESQARPAAGRPEQVVLDQLTPAECDIFIGILWQRFGTVTGAADPRTGETFDSGTQEEFVTAYESWRTTGRPEILLYRCTRSVNPKTIDTEQLTRVNRFLHSLSADGPMPTFIVEYDAVDDFESRLRQNLASLLSAHAPRTASPPTPFELSADYQARGFLRIFVPSDSNKRDEIKSEILRGADDLILLANSGFAYLALAGHRFRQVMIQRLEAGLRARFILLDPWSEPALELVLAEKLSPPGDITEKDIPAYCRALMLDSAWYRTKHVPAISGYKDLRRDELKQISCRMLRISMPASILVTDKFCFFEPYLPVNAHERLRSEMLTFELQCTSHASIYTHSRDYLENLWQVAIDFDRFSDNENENRATAFEHLSQTLLSALTHGAFAAIGRGLPT